MDRHPAIHYPVGQTTQTRQAMRMLIKNTAQSALLWAMVGLISGYGLVFAGLFLPQIWRIGFGEGFEATFHPIPLVIIKLWPFVLFLVASLFIIDVIFRLRYTVFLTATSLLVSWIWFFLVSLDAFDGPVSITKQGPTFELNLFMSTYGGFYPTSLIVIILYGIHPFIINIAQQGDASEPATPAR